MKRVLSMVVVCIVLFTLSGLTALAVGDTPDVTPPVVYAVGISPTSDPMKGCPNNAPVKVQAKATDLGGVDYVQAVVKAPSGATAVWAMSLMPDGFWRIWIPKNHFAKTGVWSIRVEATDYFNNTTKSGWKTLTITGCDRTPPTVEDIAWNTDVYASWCKNEQHYVTVTADVWDASGIKKVELWYIWPGAPEWSVTLMSHYSNLGWMGTFGNFPNGSAWFDIVAFDPYNHTTTTTDTEVVIQDCLP